MTSNHDVNRQARRQHDERAPQENPVMRKSIVAAAAAAMGILGAGVGASAQPLQNQPASVLVYPLFDSQPATSTIINVTNTNTDRSVCVDNDNLQVGDVRLHYVYYGAQMADLEAGISAPWLEFDRFEDMTPGDTLSVLAAQHNPEGEIGFLTVKAITPDTDEAIDFDYLIGSAYIANSNLDIIWCYLPYSFQAEGNGSQSTCGHDLVDGPGTIFDGSSYSYFPDKLYVDSFFEEGNRFENQLTLMSTSGQDFINEVDFLFWNNKEDRFSRTFKFVCWTTVSLSDISSVVRNLNGDPDEFVVETGWASIDGRRVLDLAGNVVDDGDFQYGPALLGVFKQTIRVDFTAGHELHFDGTQNTSLPN
jgi:hypothetical protein